MARQIFLSSSVSSTAKLLLAPALLVMFAVLTIGCGPATEEPGGDGSASNTGSDTDEVSSVTPTDPESAIISPAKLDANSKKYDQSPSAVCQRFMDLLQSGNRIGAENLMTRAALTNITSLGLKLEPMGGPKAKYTIGDVTYATNRNKLAHVDCVINETIDGETISMKIAWQARESNDCWRISGVILEKEDGNGLDLLSFENIVDVSKIKSMASEEVLDEAPTRQAKATSTEIK
ncbi:MAG: hypothetical protein AAFN77_01465 [Planctomycetota bacterium]